MGALICKTKKLRPTGFNFMLLLIYSLAHSLTQPLSTWYRPNSVGIRWIRHGLHPQVHLENNLNKMLLCMLWHLIIQQQREVGSSIIIPVGQVEKQRVWDVQNHTQNPVLRWNQNPDPQISGEFLSLNSMLPALGGYSVAPDPSLAHSLSPKGGLSWVIFFPSLTSLGFLPDEGDLSVR